MKSPFKRFGMRVVVAIATAMAVVVILSDVLIYRFSYESQLDGMREQLKIIARTAALLVDADKLMQIPLNKQGMETPAYDYISDQLKKIEAANSQIKYIYTLTKVDQSNIWRFIVDANPSNGKGLHSWPGDHYDAGRFPKMLKGLNLPTADNKIETDEWGSTLSGYAPIRDATGRPVAVLGVDMDAGNVYAVYRQVRERALVILAFGLILALLVGRFIAGRVVGPVQQLITGTRYLAEGHLHHQVKVSGDDEIKDLANSFNQMARSLEESRGRLVDYFYDTVKSLVLVLEIRDRYTMGHSESVANYAEKIARRMGVDSKVVEMFKRVTLLHDIGKVGVQDDILRKPAQLNDEEWTAIRLHPVFGEQILKPILDDPDMLKIIRHHHERYDGTGYPDRLSRDEIPLLVAIVTVADSYDAMTSQRSYRPALTPEQAIQELRHGRGRQFHPDVVDTFIDILQNK